MYFNLIAFAGFSLYDFRSDIIKQTAVAYTSTVITFLLLIGVIAYHVYLVIGKNKTILWKRNEHDLYPVQQGHYLPPKVSHSELELPDPATLPEASDDRLAHF